MDSTQPATHAAETLPPSIVEAGSTTVGGVSHPEPDYSLFPNGTSYMDWYCRNCERCWKGPTKNQEGRNRKCSIENAIALASITDGSLLHDGTNNPKRAARIAARLNWDGVSYLHNDCPEREEKRPYSHRNPRQEKGTPLLFDNAGGAK